MFAKLPQAAKFTNSHCPTRQGYFARSARRTAGAAGWEASLVWVIRIYAGKESENKGAIVSIGFFGRDVERTYPPTLRLTARIAIGDSWKE